MRHYGKLFIDGAWVEPSSSGHRTMVDPSTEEAFATVANGGDAEDVNKAVAAARSAFETYSKTPIIERVELIDSIISVYEARVGDFADIVAQEVGAPLSVKAQATGPIGHMKVARDLLKTYKFETQLANTVIRREPIGVCGLISPWNWPVQTPVIKLIYALAAGCTVVQKPSDASPISTILLTEVLERAGVPKGVVNTVIGRGRVVGEAISNHPDVDMISFTGSTAAGIKVGEAAARTVKRVSLELGGKSANIVLQDADLEKASRWNVQRCFFNAGQSCHAPSRMLVHESQLNDVIPYLIDEVGKYRIGDPRDPETTMGPLVNADQFESVQRYIRIGIDEGARLVAGGPGRPAGLNRGYFTRPTVFVDVTPEMTIANEEIFGPVLAVMPYSTEEQALKIANDSPYGLGGYVFSGDRYRGYEFAKGLHAGRICFNGANTNSLTPMGGYKQSGVGRSMGVFGLEEYLEIKSIYGFDEEAHRLPELMH
ncbi:aldehyde dehydrogenase family protein [Microvirga tunisiensis]|uniref:Aldehyde dehydrogenase family protein n=1 Tax=Microvirga tunisiensis TaxID=2108360 RepID=A0A5N7MAH1_9HYPH|nr:aldehyde dehydrogenase family protein [Microvirga tunisiensis]MPR05467.1 aldehyde dehydrogenase family protein [Microvirga tunisiensis]MPR23668.1 aldehyde dehydrogenase family protein [Microvirga tunisiensis]